MHKTRTKRAERLRAYHLAALADVDPRTALRALREGPDAVRVISARERIAEALLALEATIPGAA